MAALAQEEVVVVQISCEVLPLLLLQEVVVVLVDIRITQQAVRAAVQQVLL